MGPEGDGRGSGDSSGRGVGVVVSTRTSGSTEADSGPPYLWGVEMSSRADLGRDPTSKGPPVPDRREVDGEPVLRSCRRTFRLGSYVSRLSAWED